MFYKTFDEILEKVKANPQKSKVAVAGAANHHVLEAVFEAESMGLTTPVLIGDKSKIIEIIKDMGKDSSDYHIVEGDTSESCGQIAVELIIKGEADFIMKGMAETKDVLKPIVKRENKLNLGGTMSHIAINEVPSFKRLTFLTDGGMIPHPTLEEKKAIAVNAVETLRKIGYEHPRIAVLCGVEKVNPKMPETIDAEALSKMARDGIIGNCDIVGPISYDLVVDPAVAIIKGYNCEYCGEFDIFLAPNMAAGNILNKSLTITGGGKMAGIVVGAKIPVVITSRGSSSEEKFLSLAFASLLTQQEEI